MGLEDLGLFQNLTDQSNGPIGTLSALKSLRAQNVNGMTQPQQSSIPQSVNQGTPFKSTQVDMPDFSGGSVDDAMDKGSKRAEQLAGKKEPGGSSLNLHPMLVDLAKEMAPTDEDRNSALTQGGIGMALAGGQTGNFLTALAAGLGKGADHFQALRSQRAEQALKYGQLNSQNQYQQGMLGNAVAQTDVERGKAAAQSRYYDAQSNLIPSEIKAKEAAAREADAHAGYFGAMRDNLEGGGSGIPSDVNKAAIKSAEAAVAKAPGFESPEAREAFRKQVYLNTAEGMMRARGVDTTELPVFQSLRPTPGATPPAPKQPWMEGTYGAKPVEGEPAPLMSNPAAFMPLNSLKTLAGKGTFGAYDPGRGFDAAVNQIDYLHNDLQALNKVGGHQLKSVMSVIESMVPKQGVFVSPEQNYDKLQSMYVDVRGKRDQDAGILANAMGDKAEQKKAAERLPIENRILYRLTGDKELKEWKRFGGDQTPSASNKIHVSDGTKAYYIDPGDLAAAQKDGFKKVE